MAKRRLILMLCACLAVGGAIGGWWLSQSSPLLHPEGVPTNIAHAAGGLEDGCDKCHKEALPFSNCLDAGCHDSLPTLVGTNSNMYLAHHDVVIIDDCGSCHENSSYPGDARYVAIPETNHGFCSSCHNMMQHETGS